MNSLTNKRILLGVTGGIAAYKSAEIIRILQKADADVRVVMTRSAREFITPLTLQALSGNPVSLDLLDPDAEAAMSHIELARWADAVLVAPATADFMARMANGRGDDLLTTLCLATVAPILLAPAMNQAMWLNAGTRNNHEILKARGVGFIGPDDGIQACGDTGPGRMVEPDELVVSLARCFETGVMAGRKVVITAGPTREAIDPVRYISNHSSGKQGFALAQAAVDAGALVVLIAGPTALPDPDRIKRINVVSAEDMYQAVMSNIDNSDVFIAVAAVSDYRPVSASDQKIKKDPDGTGYSIQLVQNPDILAAVARLNDGPFTVGFAAETNNVLDHARSKLDKKQLDMILANDVSDQTIGFNSDDNRLTIVTRDQITPLPMASKKQIAKVIIDIVAGCL